jgi:hypothetical protein
VQLATWQTFPVQIPLPQSVPALQALPTAHLRQLPPQSTSDSAPFLTVSVQVGAAHEPFRQRPLVQSASIRHCPPTGHFGHALPPQSIPDSLPFFTASVQVGTAHAPELQTPLPQSVASSHVFPDAQRVQVPPQSMSLSSPFLAWSVHVGT